jgi:FtsP/CotA-like multicopper oxidase with cupredoxin domain
MRLFAEALMVMARGTIAAIAVISATLLATSLAAVLAEAGADRSFDLAIVNGRLEHGARTLRVQRGDKVELRVTADHATIIHLHGYDIELKVEPGAAAVLQFEARATGRFPLELHAPAGRHVTLLHVEVHPR